MLSGWTLLDDSYNANPLSCSRMIEAAAELRNGTGSLVFVMGEMLELGELAVPSHEELGRGMAGRRRRRRVLAWRARRRRIPGAYGGGLYGTLHRACRT